MADPTPAAVGAPALEPDGASAARLRLTPITVTCAWNLQGRLEREPFASAARDLCGTALPDVPNTAAQSAAARIYWLGPESWLLVARASATAADFAQRHAAINAAGGALFDVSAGRVAYRVDGAAAANVLASNCPLDFDLRAFARGACAQSLFGPLGALFERLGTSAWLIMVGRSYARDAWRMLCESAAPYGYEVTAAEAFD